MNGEAQTQFPQSAEAVAATLTELFRHQNNHAACNVLENAKPRIEETGYEYWDGGIFLFTLFLDLPLKVFASIESDVPKLEKLISGKLTTVLRNTGNLYLKTVAISPMLEQPSQVGQLQVAPIDYERLWEKGMLRLFLSHVSAHKENVAKLKAEFRSYGISAFVAHEDIEPNSLWQGEIELALRSMDALVALLTPNFHQSNWTDQEIGFALGRNVVVIPVKLGQDPYGFIGKHQGLPAKWEHHKSLVSNVANLLLNDKRTKAKMREAFVNRLEHVDSFFSAIDITGRLEDLNDFTHEELVKLNSSLKINDQVGGSDVASRKIKKILTRFNQSTSDDPQF